MYLKFSVFIFFLQGVSLVAAVASSSSSSSTKTNNEADVVSVHTVKRTGGHFDQDFASPLLKDKIEKKKHDQSSLINLLHKGTLSEKQDKIHHFREVDSKQPSTSLDGVRVYSASDPPVYVKEVGDEHVTTGTFLSMEYINHVNYSCTDGYVDLNQNFGLLSVQGTILGKCNPHYKTIDTLTLKNDNSFERHWTVYEYFNCTGTRVVYSKTYSQTSTCSGNFKYMYQSSEVSHQKFPELHDKFFIMPQAERCYSTRERILSFELHNSSITKFDSNQCWNMYYYTILVEAVTLSIVESSTLIGEKYESHDDQKCAGYPVKVEGWTLNKCESLGDYFSTKMNWIDIGRQTGFLFVGYSFYNSYDCTGNNQINLSLFPFPLLVVYIRLYKIMNAKFMCVLCHGILIFELLFIKKCMFSTVCNCFSCSQVCQS
jgi:hypothetical protein